MSDDETACCSLVELADPAFFEALSHDNRIQLLDELCGCEGAKSVGELSECCDVDLSVVSRHLSKLREAGIVDSEKDARQRQYSLCAEDVASLLRAMADAIESQTSTPDMEENDD